MFHCHGFYVYSDLYWLREAELKHGRIAMLAFLGTIATDAGFVVPGLVNIYIFVQVSLYWFVVECTLLLFLSPLLPTKLPISGLCSIATLDLSSLPPPLLAFLKVSSDVTAQ